MPKRPIRIDGKPVGSPFLVFEPFDLERFEGGLYAVSAEEPGQEDEEDGPRELPLTRAELEGYLDRLPPREADAVDLFYLRGCSQSDVAIVLTPDGELPYVQASISHILQIATGRMVYMRWLDSLAIDDGVIHRVCVEAYGLRPEVADRVVAVWQTTSYSEAGRRLGLPGYRLAREGVLSARKAAEQYQGDDPEALRVRTWLREMRIGVLHEQRRSASWRESVKRPKGRKL